MGIYKEVYMNKKDIKCLEERWKEIFKIMFADDKITRRDDTGKIIDFFEDLLNEAKQVEKLLQIKRIARNFVIDARGSWETGEGNQLLKIIDDFDKERKGE